MEINGRQPHHKAASWRKVTFDSLNEMVSSNNSWFQNILDINFFFPLINY